MTTTQRFANGKYKPNNPSKYVGDVAKIVYRSSWELRFNQFLDNNPNIIKWASEPFPIKYIKPTDNSVHEYWPDYWIQYKRTDSTIVEELIEVKPKKQTKPSTARSAKTKLYENLTYAVNAAKWESATRWCDELYKQTGRRIVFRIISEDQMFR